MIDFSSSIGRLRLRVGDISDLPYLPDQVYDQILADNDGNMSRAAKDLACIILGLLSSKTHKKLAQLEIWGSEAFSNYKDFLILTIKDPAFMSITPIPYTGGVEDEHPIIQFQKDWNNNYAGGTQSAQLELDASISTVNNYGM